MTSQHKRILKNKFDSFNLLELELLHFALGTSTIRPNIYFELFKQCDERLRSMKSSK